MNFKMTPIAIALAAFVATPMAMATQLATSSATINDGQVNTRNSVTNTRNTNDGTLNDNAGMNTHGNIAINAAAGDNNYQDNAAAISKQNARFVFGGSALASVNIGQQTGGNYTSNTGNNNQAGLNGQALYNASGNVAVNSAAGASNLQKNNMSISVANGYMSNAMINSSQSGSGNSTSNTGSIKKLTDTTKVKLTGSLSGQYFGFAGGATWSKQSGSYGGYYHGSTGGKVSLPYLGSASYKGGEGGHQGGSYSGKSKGGYFGVELGNVGLGGTFTGHVNTVRYVVTPSVNNASLSGSAMEYANGNVGVNVAAGSGNLQNNSMALATSTAGTP